MDLVELRRKNVKWAIQQNPVSITIRRTEYTKTNREAIETKTTKGPYMVRLYRFRQGTIQDRLTTAGTSWSNETWGLLAEYTADIRAGSNVRDEFEVPGIGKFYVKAVYPHIINGQLAGIQAELEQIG